MATINYTREQIGHLSRTSLYKWAAMTTDDIGQAAVVGYSYTDRAVQIDGTFNGATLTISGTLMNADEAYQTLRDHGGTSLTFTVAGLKAVLEPALKIRPVVTGGTNPSIDVYLLVREISG